MSALKYCLLSFCYLYFLLKNNFTLLTDLVDRGYFCQQIGTCTLGWQELYETLSRACDKTPHNKHDDLLPRPILGRLKLVWNYLRSSLPDPFLDPTLLRSKSIDSFLEGLVFSSPDSKITLIGHRRELDWLYTSDKKCPYGGSDETRFRVTANS